MDVNCKQLTVDFVNQSVVQVSGQDVVGKRSDKTDFAERLGAMNRNWQILQANITERVREQSHHFSQLVKPFFVWTHGFRSETVDERPLVRVLSFIKVDFSMVLQLV